MGDGLFLEFDNPANACLAAMEIKKVAVRDGRFSTKGGITLGMVERIKIGEVLDLMGTTVDRCARLSSMALPNQVLIDIILYGAAESFLRDNPSLCVSDPIMRTAKGLGNLEVYELSTKELGFVGFGVPFFNFVEEGRLPLQEKMSFITEAREEIIELGIGLTSFSDYFERRRYSEFKEKIVNVLKKGITIKCILLNPEGGMAKIYVKDIDEPEYLIRMRSSLRKLCSIKEEFESLGLSGFKVMIYDAIPRFHATCLDLNTPFGKISVSPYLHGVLRSKTPVMQFSSYSNPKAFETYRSSIQKILSIATEVQ